jgi:N-acetylmuramoyl-L-alanine amidase
MLESVLCLSLALYHEARSEPLEGQLLVAEVVMNRVKSKDFPTTICEVVYQPGQFSWSDKQLTIKEEKVFLDAVTLAGEVYWGQVELPGTKALFFHSGPRKGFFNTRKKVGKYGEHTFYE